MAQQLTCDICQSEDAVQMLTNVHTGDVLMIGPSCAPLFYSQCLLQVIGSDGHAGVPGKCQACRRIHERTTLAAVTPAGEDHQDTTSHLTTPDTARETTP